MKRNTRGSKEARKQGFTLIEVVLVLAIGGLIFLLAFLAFQQVSRNRRDTQRRSDAGTIMAEYQNYMGDNASNPLLVQLTISEDQSFSSGDGTNQGICDTSPPNYNFFYTGFTTKYLCKDGQFFSPASQNYTTIASGATGPPTVDQIQFQRTIGIFGVVATDCDGAAMPEGGYALRIGLESGVVCRDSR